MDYAALHTEIASGPLAGTLAPLVLDAQDQAIADILNVRTRRGPVPIAELSSFCIVNGITGAVLALVEIPIGTNIVSGVPMTLQIKGLLHTVRTLIQADFRLETADVDSSAFAGAVAGLIDLGIMSTDQGTAMTALAENRTSPAELLFGAPVTAHDCSQAR